MLSIDYGLWMRWLVWRLRLGGFHRHGVFIARGSRIQAPTEIGYGTRINGPCTVKGSGRLSIGKYCAIGEGLRVITSNHDLSAVCVQYALQRELGLEPKIAERRDVDIGHDVWIGDKVIILPGVKIESGAVVGAGSVVTRDVDPYTVVGGNPARVIRRRASEEVAVLLMELAWWDWTKERLLALHSFFSLDLETATVEQLHAAMNENR